MKRKSAFILILSFIALTPMFLQSHQELGSRSNLAMDQVEINFSEAIVPPNISTAYNVHYRMVKYAQAHQYTSNNIPAINSVEDVLSISRFVDWIFPPYTMRAIYRLMVMANGTVFLFNVTRANEVSGEIAETGMIPGNGFLSGIELNYTMKWNYDISGLVPQAAIGSGKGAIIFGKNISTNEISMFQIEFNGTTFVYLYNHTISNPILFGTMSDVDIYSASEGSSGTLINGKFNNGTDRIPFAYLLNSTLGIDIDFTNLTTSMIDYKTFDEELIAIDDSIIPAGLPEYPMYYVLTNKHIIMAGQSKMIHYYQEIPEIPSGVFPYYGHASRPYYWNDGTTNHETFIWDYLYGSFGTKTFMLYTNYTSPNPVNRIVKQVPDFSIFTVQISEDNFIKTLTDFADGQTYAGYDLESKLWQTWAVRTGSVSPSFFDWYHTYEIIEHPYPSYTGGMPSFELWFGDSRGMWYCQFSGNDTGIYNIGNSTISHALSTRIDVSHSQGTNSFQYTVSGYIQRTSRTVCEIGVIPLYGIPAVIYGYAQMFSTTALYTFNNRHGDGGIVLRPRINFQGTGLEFIEFFVSFEADYCPILSNILGLSFIPFTVYYLVWERYTNGTYAQRLLRTSFNAKSSFNQYSFALETSISIEDSHMLDELHFFSNGLEYSPYSVFLTAPNSSILVTDKVTNATLYNHYTQFSDPLRLPIPAKYEFSLRYYSTVDKFGLDFGLVNTFVNGTQVATDSIRILSPTAEIVVRDFANETIKRVVVSKAVSGIYVNLGLDIATVIISNKFNFTTIFYIEKGSTAISYSIPSDAAIILRLALGDYRYFVTDLDGKELIDKTISFVESTSISFGGVKVTPITIPGIDPILYVYVIGAVVVVIGVSFFAAVRKKPAKTRSESLKELFSYSES